MPQTVFAQLQKNIYALLEREGIAEPSEIQTRAIPKILEGKNVLVIAPTGTGKTYTAMLPVFQLFLQFRSTHEVRGISILYVTPLRALNRDLLRRLKESGEELGIKVQVRHGDTTSGARAMQAKFPPNMLITTPETLQAILPGRRMKQHLRCVKWVVVDEIHEFATDKRGAQLSLGLERLRSLTESDFQRIGLSATIGEPEKVAKFLVGITGDVEIVRAAGERRPEIKIEYVEPNDEDRKLSSRLGVPAPMLARVRRIIELISNHKSTLVFTNTREHAEALGSLIQVVKKNLPVRVHHGSLSREIRQDVERQFQAGDLTGVICTSSLELGIDIGSVDFIVQYMSPREATRLIQRVGRSGHQITGIPKGAIISGWADDILESAILTARAESERLERLKIHELALDVLAHQIVGIIMDQGRTRLDVIYETARRSYLYRDLDPETLLSVIKQLADERILTIKENIVRARSPRAFRYYYENLSTIPDVKRYTVFDFIRKRKIGTLDQEFVARSCKPQVEFIMHGSTWRVVAVDEEKLSVDVEPVAPSLTAIPSWEGEMIPVDYRVATDVGALRREIAEHSDQTLRRDTSKLEMNAEAIRRVHDTISEHIKSFDLPTERRIVVEKFENCIIVHACFGTLVNTTIGTALASLLSARHGISVATQTDPYRIGLIIPFKIDAHFVAKQLQSLTPAELEAIIMSSIESTDLFAWRQWHVARRFGAVERTADYRTGRARFLVEIFRQTPINQETRREILLEKLDLEGAKDVVSKIQSGALKVVPIEQEQETCSPLAMPIVDKVIPHDLLRPAVPTKTLADITKERLQSEIVKLICMHKADWQGIRTVRSLPNEIRCPSCRSTLVAVTYERDEQLLKIAKKKLQRGKLTPEEEREWKRGWLSASLVQTSGRRAAIAMSARGVGPSTAIRILRRFVRNEEEFYTEILKAEREYARTRMFWG